MTKRYVEIEIPWSMAKWLLENQEYHRFELIPQEHTINYLLRIPRK